MRKILSILLICNLLFVGCTKQNNKSLNESPFVLNQKEQMSYSEIQKDLSEQHIKDLDPISIAKIYVQSQFDKKYDVAYALYTDRKDHIQWTKEEDANIPDSDRGTRAQLLAIFTNIDKGEFIKTSEFEGYIKYQSLKDNKMMNGFQMVKDEDGIWNVGFMPNQ